jgi:hypothetical protein
VTGLDFSAGDDYDYYVNFCAGIARLPRASCA